MATVDLVLERCKIVTAKEILEGNIVVEAGKITGFHKAAKTPKAEETFDCKGKIVLPGAIDPHVHFRDPGKTHKEDFYTGSLSAAFGGVTTVLDMPNNNPDIDSNKNLDLKRKEIAKKAVVDYGLYAEVHNGNAGKIDKVNAIAYKAYLDEKINYENLQISLNKLKNKIISVHPEDSQIIKRKSERPLEAELEAIKKIRALKYNGNKIHFAHCTSKKSLDLIRNCPNATVEVNIPHLFFDISYAEQLGPFVKMKPPVREREVREELWNNLSRVDCLSTDHAPHTLKEKEDEGLNGMPSVEVFLRLLIDYGYRKRLDWTEIARLSAGGAAKVFGLKNKGSIEIGNDADLVVVGKDDWNIIKSEELHSKCGWSPYNRWEVKGSVEKVYLRGELIVDGDAFIGKKGIGRELNG